MIWRDGKNIQNSNETIAPCSKLKNIQKLKRNYCSPASKSSSRLYLSSVWNGLEPKKLLLFLSKKKETIAPGDPLAHAWLPRRVADNRRFACASSTDHAVTCHVHVPAVHRSSPERAVPSRHIAWLADATSFHGWTASFTVRTEKTNYTVHNFTSFHNYRRM